MAKGYKNEVERWRAHLAAERDAIGLYQGLVRAEKVPARAAIWQQLVETEERHAERWAEKLRAAGEPVNDTWTPSWRSRALGMLARVVGTSAVAPIVTALERGDAAMYAEHADAQDLLEDEQRLERVVAAMGRGGAPTIRDGEPESAAEDIAGRERWHRIGGNSSNALRAAVFGVNDGLVSNLSLVMGVAGADPGNNFILLAGVAGLMAGAFSMAAGEYVSIRSQVEMFERQIDLERDELEENPEEEAQELSLIYQAKGVPKADADRLSAAIMKDKDAALDTLAREELGLDPTELGSPWSAAISSFAAFAIGAIVPVLPYALLTGSLAFGVSVLLSALALFGVGAAVSLITGRTVLYSGARMVFIGALAAAVTYGVGHLIGVSVNG
ncbi:MAG: VIT1/CCC1 transporter family protein [Chloroflexota bacterium]